MFEDSTFESQGRIRTRSRIWMLVTGAFNGAALIAVVLVPLIYPSALPRMAFIFLMEAPPAPVAPSRPTMHVEHAVLVHPQMQGNVLFAPSRIPPHPYMASGPERLPEINVVSMTGDSGDALARGDVFSGHTPKPVVRQQSGAPVRVSGMVVEGLLVRKTVPDYPAIARAAGIQGTVMLQATISRAGTIENLRVINGPIMLQQAAMAAVRTWRYRPYLLSGEPVEVETTINVVFKLN
jgi:periplasmic protein TonB